MENQTMSYAGFWKRFVAIIIDSILVSVVETILLIPILAMSGITIFRAITFDESPSEIVGMVMALLAAYLGWMLMTVVVSWLYFALMESSGRGATVGKLALGIRVVDMSGNRISFGRATARYFAKILSALIFMIGYLMAAFTDRKQALHDTIAGCLVINERR
jgi:uncharacterized RDD family membrane protein YckC